MNDLCAVETCESVVYRQGWCTKHYGRWKRHGDTSIVKKTRNRASRYVYGNCKVCNAPITAQMGRKRKHCSQACRDVTQKELLLSWLTVDSSHGSSGLRVKCFKYGLLEPKCVTCGLTEWMGKTGVDAPLQLDHINGNGTDCRIENLQILCANCHMQTDTYAGRNIGNTTRKKYVYSTPK